MLFGLFGRCKFYKSCKLYDPDSNTCTRTRGYWKGVGTFDEEEANCRRKLDEKEEGLAKQLKIEEASRKSSTPYNPPF